MEDSQSGGLTEWRTHRVVESHIDGPPEGWTHRVVNSQSGGLT